MLKLDMEETVKKISTDENYTMDQRMTLLHALDVLKLCIHNQYGPLIVGENGQFNEEYKLYDMYLICPKFGSDIVIPYVSVLKKTEEIKNDSSSDTTDKTL